MVGHGVWREREN
jgi:hypothetical protein